MKNLEVSLIKETIKKPWLTVNDLYNIYPVGKNKSREMFSNATKKAIELGMFIPTSRPSTVPTSVVLELYPIWESTK